MTRPSDVTYKSCRAPAARDQTGYAPPAAEICQLHCRRECFGQYFYCHFAIEPGVSGAIHGAHATLAELAGDVVVPELVAQRETHGIAPFYPSATGSRFSFGKR